MKSVFKSAMRKLKPSNKFYDYESLKTVAKLIHYILNFEYIQYI